MTGLSHRDLSQVAFTPAHEVLAGMRVRNHITKGSARKVMSADRVHLLPAAATVAQLRAETP
jgi:hypothetical protein